MGESHWQWLLSGKINGWTSKLQQIPKSIQKMLWMQNIPNQTDTTTWRHSSIRQNYKNKIFSSYWCRFRRSNHVSQQEKRRKKTNTFFHMQFNKGNPFIITSRSNHRWFHKSIEETNCKKKIFWKNILAQCKELCKSF